MFKLHLDVFGYAAFINIYILLGKIVEASEKNSKPQSSCQFYYFSQRQCSLELQNKFMQK